MSFSRFLEMYEIEITGNRLTCDCSILTIKRKIGFLLQNNPSWKTRFKTWKCAWPEELKDRNILEINENHIIAQKKLEYCPVECSCFERCMDQTVVIDCEGRNLTKVPRIPSRGPLIELNLRNNNIRDIPVYPYFKNLLALYLTNNNIQQFNAMAVNNFKRIRVLHIDSNNLSSLPRNIEEPGFTNLALHDNAFKCSCNLKWMKNWLQKLHHRNQVKNIENVLCQSDSAEGVKAIYTLPDENFGCNETAEYKTVTNIIQEKTSTIIAVTLGSLLAMTLIIFILLLKYRRVMKAFMYAHFNWHPFDHIDDADSSKIYDAFVSYSEKQRQWVVNTLQERLENRHPPYKLCIHHRDFEIGAPIVRNILNSVEQSKRMVMVLSRNFLQSEWCMLEFRTAHHKALEDRLKLIIIMFDDVSMAELDEEMKLYMRTNTYVSVSDTWFWEKLIHAMPQSSVRELEERSKHDYDLIESLQRNTKKGYIRESFI
ncbi:axis elongation [Desmophyllum pertusum]|uniref:Axis elongation n=1 Tax=Desmophyllum pertusum TaxID=174260 RepID=A0A9X0A2S7_9CNID|nr:axis elongation [Desmophyllum pertusum]